jgi:AraC-like DNA-binding protein
VEAVNTGRVKVEALRHGHYPGKVLPAGALPGIKMVGFWDAQGEQQWGLSWHRNEGVEFTFLESGNLEFAAEARNYTLQADDLTVVRPWQLHRVGDPYVAPSRLIWLILDVGVRRPNQEWKWPSWLMLSQPDREELTNILRHNEQPVWKAATDLRRCFCEIARCVEADLEGNKVSRLTVRINEMILLLLEMFRTKKMRLDSSLSSTRRTVQLFLNDLQTHPKHLEEEWTLEGMAASCGLGVTQFVHHVRNLTNMSPMSFLSHCRVELAVKILRERPEESVTAIAMQCSFSSSQYFATVFARRVGCSPSEYRARCRGNG